MVKPPGRLRPSRQRIETWINITQTQAPNPCTDMGGHFFFLKEHITIHFFPERLTSQVKAIKKKKKKQSTFEFSGQNCLKLDQFGQPPQSEP